MKYRTLAFLGVLLSTALAASSGTYYSKVNVSAPSGNGAVYATTNGAVEDSDITQTTHSATYSSKGASQSAQSADHTYNLYAKPFEGYGFSKWSDGSTDNPHKVVVTATSTKEATPTLAEYTVSFEPTMLVVTNADPSLGSVKIDKSINKVGDIVTMTASIVMPDGSGEFSTTNSKHPSRSISFEGWYDEAGVLLSDELKFQYEVRKSERIEARFNREFTIKADADNNVKGYYRLQSMQGVAGVNYFLTMLGDMQVSITSSSNSTQRFLTGIVGFGPNMPVWGSNTNLAYAKSGEVYANPANIFYVTGKATADLYTEESRKTVVTDLVANAQGLSVNSVLSGSPTFDLKTAATPGYYLVSYSAGTLQLHYFQSIWVTTDKPTDSNFKDNGDFDVQPVDFAHVETNYFGAMPSESMRDDDGRYWTSMYASFPYECYGPDGVKAYVVDNVADKDGNKMVVVRCLESGIVPAGTPVLLSCAGLLPKENRLIPLMPEDIRLEAAKAEAEGNLLAGSYSLWTSRTAPSGSTNYHTPSGRPTYDAETMRVFSVNSGGSIGFYKLGTNEDGSAKPLASNRVYLDMGKLPANVRNASSLRIVYGDNWESGIGSVSADTDLGDEDAEVEYHTLDGIKVTHPVKGNIYIKRKGAKVTKIVY